MMRPVNHSFQHATDLASERLGGCALEASDEFFAPKESLLLASEPVFKPDLYTERGKWMDGWESRRKRTPGNDWCVIRLGAPGRILGLDVDTRHFVGNHPPEVSIDVARFSGTDLRDVDWKALVSPTPIDEDDHNYITVENADYWTHVRLNMHPDGGIARFRVYGEVKADRATDTTLEISSLSNGGCAIACSDDHFCNMSNLLLPGPARNMGDGWETRRKRGPGHDWVVIKLGSPSVLEEIHVDTSFYKGNYPDRCSIEALDPMPGPKPDPFLTPDGVPEPDNIPIPSGTWTVVVPETSLTPDHNHRFSPLLESGPFTHIRLNIFPDGGVARLRVFGRISTGDPVTIEDSGLAVLNRRDPATLNRDLLSCCASPGWAGAVQKNRPYASSELLLEHATRSWNQQPEHEWLLAFAAHPEIGNMDTSMTKIVAAHTGDDRHRAWSSDEQATVQSASDSILRRLSKMNTVYRERFGYTFLICATGLSAEEMLSALESRMNNTTEQELGVAGEEQRKILHLRLEKLLNQYGSE